MNGRPYEREFEDFFDAVWPRAKTMALRMGLGPEAAEDVALDALAVAYDRWHRIRDLSYREPWALKVTANLSLRALKRRRNYALSRPQAAPSPEDEVAGRLDVRSLLLRLSRRQRQVLALRYLADLSEAQVADALGIDLGSVKQYASRGRAAALAASEARFFDAC